MSNAVLTNAIDLRTGVPRSPNALVGDYILLARIIDKCRALIAGTIGEYNYNCPLDRRFFDFTGVDADAFKAEVEAGKSDDALLDWVRTNASIQRTQEEIMIWSYQTRHAPLTDPDKQGYFEARRREIAPDKPYLRNWFELIDAEEGRL